MKVRSAVAASLLAAAVTTASFATSAPASARVATDRVKPAPSDACGTEPLKPDGTRWRCTFVDDFATTSLDRTKWVPQTAFVTGSPSAFACYVDDPSTVNVANGSLNLTVHQVATPVSCNTASGVQSTSYVAGMVSTYHLFSQQYGRFEARVRNTATTYPGLHEAFWLWPDDRYSTINWPTSGEIDVSETYSVYPNLSVPFLHYSADSGGSRPGVNTAYDCTAYRGQWNTYTFVWSATRLEILVNGRSCLVNTSGDPAFQKPYIIAFTQALGSTGNEYDGRAPIPATMNIDYIRVWK